MKLKKTCISISRSRKGRFTPIFHQILSGLFFPFVGVTTATITADIVEFNPSEDEKKNNVFNDLRNKRETELLQQKTFALFADTVGVWIGGELNKMEVVSNENTNSIILKGSNNTEFIYGEEQLFLLKPVSMSLPTALMWSNLCSGKSTGRIAQGLSSESIRSGRLSNREMI